jgi:hypothetical protein
MAVAIVLEKREGNVNLLFGTFSGQVFLGRVFAIHHIFESAFREVQKVRWVISGLEENVQREVFIVQGAWKPRIDWQHDVLYCQIELQSYVM